MRSAGLPLTIGYTGHPWDRALGQYFAPFRYYNPATARWNMRDPLGFVDGPNVYAYVAGNPVSGKDMLGLERIPGCRRPKSPTPGDWNWRNRHQEPEWEYPYVPKDVYDDAMRLNRGGTPNTFPPSPPASGKGPNPNRYERRGKDGLQEILNKDTAHPGRPYDHVYYIRYRKGVGIEKWIIYPDGSCEKDSGHGKKT